MSIKISFINTKYDKEAAIASGDILRVLKNPSLAVVYYNKVLRNNQNNREVLIEECLKL